MFTLLAKVFNALNSDASPIQIALALALSMLVAFNSMLSAIGLIAMCLLFILRVNIGAFFIGLAIFATCHLLLNSTFISIGNQLLTSAELNALWTTLYQTYWFRLSELNNTLMMGAFVSSLVLFIPTLILSRFLIVKYRISLMAFVNKFKIVKTLKASKFYQIYDTLKA